MSFKIVYIDDEPDLCEVFRDNFALPDVSIQTFTDPEQAIQSMETNPPDLVFIDFRLPNTSGDKVALRINPAIPKVLLSGDLTLRSFPCFVQTFRKPYDFDEIEQFIKNYL